MNSTLRLFISAIICFNLISLHECFFGSSDYTIYECQENNVVVLSENDYNIKTQQPDVNHTIDEEQKKAFQKKQTTDIRYYKLLNELIKEDDSDNKESNKEENLEGTIEDPEVLNTIKEGVQDIIKMLKTNHAHRNLKFFKSYIGYIELPRINSDIAFSAFSIENFLNLRKLFNVEEDFNYSFNLDAPLVKQDNGKDKVKLFYTADYKFIIQTISYKEQHVLKTILFDYFSHYCKYPDSLLPKISGLYHIKHYSIESYLIVMQNMYPHPLLTTINKQYYLKGADKEALISEDKGNHIFRLLDYNFIKKYPSGFIISPTLHKSIKQILKNDCEFLQKKGMTNYSLKLITSAMNKPVVNKNKAQSSNLKVQQQVKNNNVVVNIQNKSLLITIVFNSILHKYDISRIIEHTLKGRLFGKGDKTTIQNPEKYANRFLGFIFKSVFLSPGK